MRKGNAGLKAVVVASAGIVLAVACKDKLGACTHGVTARVSGDESHTLTIPKDHLERGVGGTYVLKGKGHQHAILLKDADLAALKAGKKVKTRASSQTAHTHEVEISCK